MFFAPYLAELFPNVPPIIVIIIPPEDCTQDKASDPKDHSTDCIESDNYDLTRRESYLRATQFNKTGKQ